MGPQLYILNDDNEAKPVNWGDYQAWEERIRPEDRCALGKLIRKDCVKETVVVTFFLASPSGFHGRSPQCWISIVASPNLHEQHVYSSHRACISGHNSILRKLQSGSYLGNRKRNVG